MQTVSDTQRQLEGLDHSDVEYRPLLVELLSHQDLRSHVQSLYGSDLEGFVEFLDKALSHIPATDDLSRKILRRLQSICSNREVLPRSHIIARERLSNKRGPIASGGVADAYEAELDGEKVCIKALRSYVQDATAGTTRKAFYREVVVWKRLRHPNIVPFLGVPSKIPPFEIVCEWMENDRITEYAKANPEADRVSLLWDAADGLHYLHSCNVIHGDLKGANILVDKNGHARLADFGLASVIRGENSIISAQASSAKSTTTWAAPEVLGGGPVSKEGDIFTFAMVAVETFTGHSPFVSNYHAAIFDIIAGKHPERPKKLHHEGLWKLMKECWSKEPSKRPTSSQLLVFFQTSFPGKRETPEAQPLSNVSSTWTLVATKEPIGGNTGSLPGPSKKLTTDEEPGPQDPFTGGVQVGVPRPTNISDSPGQIPTQVPNEDPPPQAGGKPPLFKRTVRRLKKFMKKLFSRKAPSR